MLHLTRRLRVVVAVVVIHAMVAIPSMGQLPLFGQEIPNPPQSTPNAKSIATSASVMHHASTSTASSSSPSSAVSGNPPRNDLNTDVAREVARRLDEPAELRIEASIEDLDTAIATALQMPVLMNPDVFEFAQFEPTKLVKFDSQEQPIRTLLRKLLMPLRLTTKIEDEGLVIIPDFMRLARDGIATDRWVSISEAVINTLDAQLNKRITLDLDHALLSQAIDTIAQQIDAPIRIDQTSLEEIGLAQDCEVSLVADDVTVKSAFYQLLTDIDLTFHYRNDVIEITTNESAESFRLSRLYFLEGTGMPRGDYQSITELIQSSIEPRSWEVLGGVGTITGIGDGLSGRPSILVSAKLAIHGEISLLMKALRDSHTGPDPVISPEKQKSLQRMMGGFGGGMGGGGMGGGGMGGGGMF